MSNPLTKRLGHTIHVINGNIDRLFIDKNGTNQHYDMESPADNFNDLRKFVYIVQEQLRRTSTDKTDSAHVNVESHDKARVNVYMREGYSYEAVVEEGVLDRLYIVDHEFGKADRLAMFECLRDFVDAVCEEMSRTTTLYSDQNVEPESDA